MLDKRSAIVLRALSKLSEGSAYKVITADEIIASLTQKSQYDADSIRQIIEFLEKQEYLNIKFSEENTYCYSLLPKARIYLEQETGKSKQKKSALTIGHYIVIALASFIGTMIALMIFFYITI